MSTTMTDFIDQAWNDHVADAAGVAARLRDQAARLEQSPDQLGPFVQLAEHVLIGHLGDADAMEGCLQQLAGVVADEAVAQALGRARFAAALLRGPAPLPAELSCAAAIRAHGSAVCGQAARGDIGAARRLLQAAAALAHDAESGDVDANKALAACYHNLAAQLQQGPRSPDADTLMMEAARQSRSTWSQAGTWVNVERADYMLALCAEAIGDAAQAVQHARSCLEICDANGADAFERVFAHEALGKAWLAGGDRAAAGESLAAMRLLVTGIDDGGNRAYAQRALDTLQAAVSHP